MAVTDVDSEGACRARERRSASSILLGGLAGLCAAAVLSLAGVRLGLALADPWETPTPVDVLDESGVLWLCLLTVAGFVGGALSAWLGRPEASDIDDNRLRIAVQGLTACAVAVVIAGMATAAASAPTAIAQRSEVARTETPKRPAGELREPRLTPSAVATLWGVLALSVADARRR